METTENLGREAAAPAKLRGRARYANRPLKAYEVFFNGKAYGRFVGRTAGQAKAALARDLYDCYDWRDIWRNLSCKSLEGAAKQAVLQAAADRGKYWRDKSENVRLQAECDAFNAAYPVGTPVQVVDCCEASNWPGGLTKTRTPAWLSGPGCALVSVEGYSGGFYMENIKPEPAAHPTVTEEAAAQKGESYA